MSIPLILSSDNSGAPATDNRTGDRFTIDFPTGIQTPGKWSVVPVSAKCWFTSPNSSSSRSNNKFTFNSTVTAPTGIQTVTIPDGLYGVKDLETEINSAAAELGYGSSADPLIKLVPRPGAQRMVLVVRHAGYIIDNSAADAVLPSLMGFSATALPVTTTVSTTFRAPNIADMSLGVDSYLIHLSILDNVRSGHIPGDVAFEIKLTGIANTLLVERNLLAVSKMPLHRTYIDSITCHLTDAQNRPISLNNNSYSLHIILKKESD